MPVNKELLLKSRLPEAEVDIPGVGTVRVRGLSRAEVLGMKDLPNGEAEQRMVSAGLIDPELTADEVAEWQHVALVGEIDVIVTKIMDLSGLSANTANETWKEMESDPDAEFRDVPGAATGDDGGTASGGDV